MYVVMNKVAWKEGVERNSLIPYALDLESLTFSNVILKTSN